MYNELWKVGFNEYFTVPFFKGHFRKIKNLLPREEYLCIRFEDKKEFIFPMKKNVITHY